MKFDGLHFYVQILACGLFKPESLQQQTQANRLLALDMLSVSLASTRYVDHKHAHIHIFTNILSFVFFHLNFSIV